MQKKHDKQVHGHTQAQNKHARKGTVPFGWKAAYLEESVRVKAEEAAGDCVGDPKPPHDLWSARRTRGAQKSCSPHDFSL